MNFFRILIISSMIVLFTGCGGGGSGGNETASANNITPQTVAIDIIIAYADDNTQPSPTVGDYSDAGIIGVNADNLVNVNIAIDALIGTDVDTIKEIQAVVDEVIATLAAKASSDAVLSQIGLEADDPDSVNSIVTVTQLDAILPALTDINSTNETAYQDYIDANPNAFSDPATAAEVQAMLDAVNAEQVAIAASDAVLSQIGLEADNPDSVNSIVTVTQLGSILPAVTDINSTNETAYQDYIDANPDLFSYPATLAEVQSMIDTVNAEQEAIAESNAVLSQIGLEADDPDSVNSIVTIVQLDAILPALTDINSTNETAYQDYIDANPNSFASPATSAEVQAMINTVNAEQEAIAVSASVLVQIGAEGDTGDTTNSVVTVAQLGDIQGLTDVVAANETAYQDYIDANPDKFSSPATLSEVQAMIDTVNAEQVAIAEAIAASDALLLQIGLEADNPDSLDSVVTVAQLGDIQGLTGIEAANITAYQDYIDANPDLLSDPATLAEVQAMVNAVNAAQAAPSTGESNVTASQTLLLNDGIATSTITVTVKDANANPITNATVILTQNGSSTISVVTNNNDGTYTFTVKSTKAETVTYTATAETVVITQTADVTFIPPNIAGTLDNSFDFDGIVVYDSARTDVGNSITIDNEGSIYVTGYSWSNTTNIDMIIWKYTSDGILDSAFGTDGIVKYDGPYGDYGYGITVDSMGNIYVTGSVQSISSGSMAIWKYTSNGTLDTSFGTDGMVKYINSSVGNAITLDNIGNIYVTGQGKLSSSEVYSHMIIWKYTSDGVLDTSFSDDGVVAFNNDNMPDRGYGIVVDSTHVYVTGYTGYNGNIDMSIWKCTTNGVLDNAFGIDGNGMVKYINANVDFGRGIKLDSAGNIIVTGYTHNSAGNDDMVLWKYSNDGTSDTSFGTDGIIVNNSAAGGNGDDRGYGITLDSLDNIYVTGYSRNSTGNDDMAIWKYSNNGTPDITFGTFGIAINHNAAGGDSVDVGTAITLDHLGSLYVTGYSSNGANVDMVIWKYLSGIPSEIIALDKIQAYANDNTQPSPTVEDYVDAGITGVNADNLAYVNISVDALIGTDVDTTTEIQAIVDAVNTPIDAVGTLDTTFSGDGIAVYEEVVPNTNRSYSIVTDDSTGSVYVTGSSDGDMIILKYTHTGNLDPAFGIGGIVTHNNAAGGNGNDVGRGIALDSTGNIYVVGYSDSSTSITDYNMIIWKYTSTGILDSTFGTDGIVNNGNIVANPISDKADYGYAITLDSSGSIYVTGASTNMGSLIPAHLDMVICKYTNDGILDTSFGENGIVHDSVRNSFATGYSDDYGYAIVLDSSNNIYVTGTTNYFTEINFQRYLYTDMVTWKYTSDGTKDTTFGTNGIVTHNSAAGGNGNDIGYGIALDGSDNIYIVGTSDSNIDPRNQVSAIDNDMVIWKYTSDGVLDTTFDNDGIIVHKNAAGGNAEDVGKGIVFDSLDNFYVAGYSDSDPLSTVNQDMVIWKYTSDGVLDTTFDYDGIVKHDENRIDRASAIALDALGKVYITGESLNAVTNYFDIVTLKYE